MTFSSWIRSWKRSIERRWALHHALRRKAVARRLATRPRLEILEDRWLLSAYVVTSTADSGTGSLRDAINSANNTASGITEIDFNIGTKGTSSGVQTISPATALPALTASGVFINGYSENQWQGVTSTSPLIELNGTATTGDGLQLSGANNSVSGLIIEGFTDGIEVGGANNDIGGTTAGAGNVISGNTNDGVLIRASGVAVQGNYIGTDVTGTQANANSIGIEVGGSNCTIGGTTSGARNVISGNSYKGVDIPLGGGDVQVQGNYIGTNATGSAAVADNKAGFGQVGIDVAGINCTIGGTTSGARNIISGNISDGVDIDAGGFGVAVQGNYIGTDVTGAYAVANSVAGVAVDASSDDTIGGTTSGAGNIISGNGDWGVLIGTPGAAVQGNYIGTDVTGTKAIANGTGIEVAVSNNTIGGTISGAGNIISGNTNAGVSIDYGASGVQVQGNFIGTNAAGNAALANSVGIEVAGSNNTIGGTVSGALNLISGNSADGVLIDSTVSGVAVQGNYIGTDVTGTRAVANGIGVSVAGSENTIGGTAAGAGNVISGNTGSGVALEASGVAVQGNHIGTDVRGTRALANSIGVSVTSSDNTIGGTVAGAGNVISGNADDGVLIEGGISGVQVQGNFIGTNAAGNAALANSGNGVEVDGSNNTIGGTAIGARNIISGNTGNGVDIGASGVAVQGNYIGTDVTGTNALANSTGVLVGGSNDTIGGTVSGAGNLISGNQNFGLDVFGGALLVQGNYIGTDSTGTTAVANGRDGVDVELPVIVTIGGTTVAARNIISGNTFGGVFLVQGGALVQGNYIGTDVTGTKAIANGGVAGVWVNERSSTIGGTASGAGNIISGNEGDGVFVQGFGALVQGNYIGTDVTGTVAIANGGAGIEAEASNTTIGGTTTAARNIISGNYTGLSVESSGVVVQGNYIGTDVTGTKAVANTYDGVEYEPFAFNSTLGGTAAGAGNVISGNGNDGVFIDPHTSGVVVQGNYIGTNAAGSAALANSVGIEVAGSNSTIGGTISGALNVISGNSTDGVLIDYGASGVQVQGNYIGTDVTGTKAVANSIGVYEASSDNTIGGTATGAGNVISGNTGSGVALEASGVSVQGNHIGTNVRGIRALANSTGVSVASSDNTIGGTVAGAGNVISGNADDGVLIDNGASGVAVQGNYLGTNAAGTSAVANGTGIEVDGSNNTIGGTAIGARNIISGNTGNGVGIGATGVAVQGNYIGTDVTGTNALANSNGVLVGGSNDTIGGTASGAGNLISGNTNYGVFSAGDHLLVQGNYIGTDVTGTKALANLDGIGDFGTNTTVGGTAAAARNIISGNTSDGVNTGISTLVQGNYVGTDVTGTKAVANGFFGVWVNGPHNTIGGTASGAGNVLSGNTFDGLNVGVYDGLVQGNYIGTDATGTVAIGNGGAGIETEGNNTIGGTTAAARNIISGNYAGLIVEGSGVVVQGNYIGTDVTGTKAVANTYDGVEYEETNTNDTLGGTAAGAGNVISGNGKDGVFIYETFGVAVQGNYIGTNAVGNVALANSIGIEVAVSNNTIGGTISGALNVISGNTADGVLIDYGVSGVQVQGNYIGTDVTGANAVANNVGVEVAGSNNTIGGTTSAARNIISGNSADGVLIDNGASGVAVQGNYIGTDVTGTNALANGGGVQVSSSNNTIGGTTTGAGNLISGNTGGGVFISASGVAVQGNYIGTDVTGTNALANPIGIGVSSSNDTIGGTAPGAGNLISGNTTAGVISAASGLLVQGNYIGTDVTGTLAVANGDGIYDVGSNMTIGGTTAAARNRISGNSNYGIWTNDYALVQGNYIGTDVTGTKAVANFEGIYVDGLNDTIGGTASGAGNLISGNADEGVLLDFAGALVQGNYIGTDVTGTTAVGNGAGGMEVLLSSTIGGTSASARNIISGNGVGVSVAGTGVVVQGNYIGTDVTGSKAVANINAGVEYEETTTNDTLGGTAAGAGNVISGNGKDGVLIDRLDSGGVQVQGNYIGTNAAGNAALANSVGIEVAGSNNTIGGIVSGALNVISGNTADGVLIDSSASGVAVQGNYIGTDATGTRAVANSIGVSVAGSDNTIGGTVAGAGNVISGNTDDGVLISASGVAVQGNYIGTNAAGNAALANSNGIEVAGSNNTIGGTVAGAGNLISGNTTDGVVINFSISGVAVQGNYIGTDVTGTKAVANTIGVSVAGSGNTIGGTAAGAGNVISSNHSHGVYITAGSGNVIQGNLIGTDVTGTQALGNGDDGIQDLGKGDTIGGATPGTGNVISANDFYGIVLDGTGFVIQGNLIGTDITGTKALGNVLGINDQYSAGNTIGGTIPGAGNVISGNRTNGISLSAGSGSGDVIQGNLIGTDATGTEALGNGVYGINSFSTSAQTLIGGTTAGAGNVISGNHEAGIILFGNNNVIEGNFVGTDISGTQALGNQMGIVVGNPNSFPFNNTIGGTALGAGNLISGNTQDGISLGGFNNVVQGNLIGTDITGAKALGNGLDGVLVTRSHNTIGGTAAGAGNLISGNAGNGVSLDFPGGNNLLQGNRIGTDITGTKVLGNGGDGVEIYDSSDNTVGGSAPGAGNVISGNGGSGIFITFPSGNVPNATSNLISGNYIGTNAAGTAALANSVGIEVAVSNNTIGGTVSGARNVISGNSADGVLIDSTASGVAVQGNYIGTDVTGANAALANSVGIEVAGSNNTIGGTISGARNVISGNSTDGVLIDSGVSGVAVQGNYIGTDVTGANALGNGANGMEIFNGSGNTVGGSASGAGNLISANAEAGLYINGASASGNQVQGNRIGTDALGANRLSNGTAGVFDNGLTSGISINDAPDTLIGGTDPGAGNLISGNRSWGLYIQASTSQPLDTLVEGNFIGTDATGTQSVKNGYNGVNVESASGNTIGGTTSAARNIISGNGGNGVVLATASQGPVATNNFVEGNYIGTDVTGTHALGNGGSYLNRENGVEIDDAVGNIIGGTASGTGNLISSNSEDGVLIKSVFASPFPSNNLVEGNYIGTDVTGSVSLGNGANGVEIIEGSNNTIGGTVSGAGNLISGNDSGVQITGLGGSLASGNLVQGNLIGTDVTGTAKLANAGVGVGIYQASGNTIGGTTSAARNIISGYSLFGMELYYEATQNYILGNYIGTDITGTKAVGNGNGIYMSEANNNFIGGTTAGAGNLISGNAGNGPGDGLDMEGSSGNLIAGNLIGTDSGGSVALANAGTGIDLDEADSDNTIGGTSAAARNVVSGNRKDGIFIGYRVTGSLVQGNLIGTDLNGTQAVANSIGIEVAGNNNTIGGSVLGARNIIAGNATDGVLIASGASGTQVLGNWIGTNYNGTATVANSIGIEVAGNSNTVGGASGSGNVISGNTSDGVMIDKSASGTQVLGNTIGVNFYDQRALANSGNGIEVAGSNNTLGASWAVAFNEISGNSGDGVKLDSGSSGNQVLGSYIGTDHTGTIAVHNRVGIEDGGSSNTIGGSVLGARNVISGNRTDGVLIDNTATNETMQSNYIGTDYSASTAIANGANGVEIQGSGNTIGSNAGANYFIRNIISGNTNGDGVKIDGGASGNQVQGNFIGIDVSGTNAVANSIGVEIAGNSNTIGGTGNGAGNVISGNTYDGVRVDSNATGNLIQGSFVGTDYTGLNRLANHGIGGIEIDGSGNTAGGTASGARNIISGNLFEGMFLLGNGNQVLGNYIGINAAGNAALGNGDGINVLGQNNVLGGTASGAGNVISGNDLDGVIIREYTTGTQVLGNYIGTDAAGTAALSNGGVGDVGVHLSGHSNTVGGAAGARNVISGNAGGGVLIDQYGSGNLVLGNLIGVNAYDSAALGNGNSYDSPLIGTGNGIDVAGNNNTLGASWAVAPNIISGNYGDGVKLDSGSSGNVVLGNYIGTDHTGTKAVANTVGIDDAGSGNSIGGSVLGARNVISGNSTDGVRIDSSAKNETMLGNYIGTDYSASTALANGSNGVEIQGSGNTIGGQLVNAFIRNYIDGNTKGDGVKIDSGASGNQVQGNFIGVNVSGTVGLANSIGVEIGGSSNTVGGTSAYYTNVISGNSGDGVLVDSTGAGNVIQGSFVGTDYTGQAALGNGGNGIAIAGNNNTVGTGNIIAYNSNNGVEVSSGAGNTITQNSIFSNTGLGISLASGANNNIVAPTISTATLSGGTLTVTGTFTATVGDTYLLEFFADSATNPQGRIYLGNLSVPATSTTQSFTFTTTNTSQLGTYPDITATLTDNTGDTSEFSAGVTVSLG